MGENGAMTVIAHIESQFHTKFGIPRQSGLVEELEADVVFEPQFRDLNALRGLEGFSHIWLIWDFSEVRDKGWTPTVRPPRLGGNRRLGVLAIPVPLPSKPYRPKLCPAGGNRSAHGTGACPPCQGG